MREIKSLFGDDTKFSGDTIRFRRFQLLPGQTAKVVNSEERFAYLVVLQGALTQAYGSYILQGYGIGGIRYHAVELGKGSQVSVRIPSEGNRYFEIENTSTSVVYGSIVSLLHNPIDILIE